MGKYSPEVSEREDGILKIMTLAAQDYEYVEKMAKRSAEDNWKYDGVGNEYPYVIRIGMAPGRICPMTDKVRIGAVVIGRVIIFDSERKRVEYLEKETNQKTN